MNTIEVKQLPVIQHDLKTIGANVRKLIADLNLDKLIATDETLQYLKKTRAELNKEFAAYEEQRKAVKKAVMAPYDAFELEYKENLTEIFSNADNVLKSGIASVEIKAKDAKKEVIKAYFAELCASNNIDFITFEQTGIEINLSTSEKQYKERCQEIINKVNDDLVLIDAYDYKAEVLVEYKRTLNCSAAITTVKARKEAEQKEAERLKAIEEQKAQKAPETPLFEKLGEIFQPPVIEQKEAIKTAEFRVKATEAQLKALGQYMRDNSIFYENI